MLAVIGPIEGLWYVPVEIVKSYGLVKQVSFTSLSLPEQLVPAELRPLKKKQSAGKKQAGEARRRYVPPQHVTLWLSNDFYELCDALDAADDDVFTGIASMFQLPSDLLTFLFPKHEIKLKENEAPKIDETHAGETPTV